MEDQLKRFEIRPKNKAVLCQNQSKGLTIYNQFTEQFSVNDLAKKVQKALQKIDIKVPLVIRLAGTNVDKGNQILKESKINYIEANTLEEAANKAVKALES